MATLRQKKSGFWFLEYRDVDGERFRVSTGTKDLKKAELWKNKVEEMLPMAKLGIIEKIGRVDADVIAGRKKEDNSTSLSEFKAIYEDRCRNDLELAENTININNLAWTSFIHVVGDMKLKNITDESVRTWKRRMSSMGRSKTTLAMYHRHLRASLKRAIKWKLTESNPFALVEVAKWRNVNRETKNMSFDEVKTLLKEIDNSGEKAFGDYVRFCLYTAGRRNEVLYLRRENMDLEHWTVHLRSEKTSTDLVLPINKALRRTIENMELPESGYIFRTNCSRTKDKEIPWHPSSVSHWFKQFIRAAVLPDHYSLHSLRHTYATYLRQQGVPLDLVQKLIGHKSPLTTAENYDHSIALHFREQADLVDFEEEQTDSS